MPAKETDLGGLAFDAKGDEVASVRVDWGRKEAYNSIAHLVRKGTLVLLFIGGYKLVHSVSKVEHNYALDFRLAFKGIKLATNGPRCCAGVRIVT
jgi:hypothetical protein